VVASGFISIYLIIDFLDKIDNFKDAGKPMGMTLLYFFLNIPFILDQLGPILILLAGVITLGILNHNNELTAMKAGGIPLRKIINPILAAGICSTMLFFIMAQWILPKTISTTNSIWHEEVQGKVPLGVHRNNRYYYKGHEGFYSFEWPDSDKYAFHNFSYSCWNESYNLKSMTSAEWALWKDNSWTLQKGQIQRQNDTGYHIENFTDLEMPMPESPEQFFIPEYRSAELSLTGLFRDIFNKDSERSSIEAWVHFFGRISYLLLGLPLLVLGLPVLLIAYKKWGRDLSIAIPASCGIAFLAWGGWGALQSLAKAGYLSPFFASSAVHLFFAIFGLILLRNQER
jgi:lipopolysaccharide export system permease protein